MAEGDFVVLEDRGMLAVVGTGPARLSARAGLERRREGRSRAARVYAALLTAQGKYLHDFIMVEAGEAIWLDAEAARLADLQATARRSIGCAPRSMLGERPDLAVAAVFGESALAALGLAGDPGAARSFGAGVAFVDPRLAALGARCILPRETARAALAASALLEADFAAYDRLRLGLGIPDGSRDLVPEKSILLESGFDELNGVDWQKGCYIGQELTARTKYRGLIKKRLLPIEIDGPAPAPGTIVTADGREAGEMRSSRDGHGLALLRLEPVLAGKRLEVEGAAVTPTKPGWMRLESEAVS